MSLGSKQIKSLKDYPFWELERKVRELKEKGVSLIDFGIGDPTVSTPKFIREETKRAIDILANAGYPSYIGSLELRQEIARWMKSRFGLVFDPEREIVVTLGSKEAIFNFPKAFIDPGDIVICPSPGYPPCYRGALFAGSKVYFYPLLKEYNFLPPLEMIPKQVASKARVMWINYPNSPTGKVASFEELEKIAYFCETYNIILASDEAYSEIYFGEAPCSILNINSRNKVGFFSLSKRSAMTCYRVGWVVGSSEIIGLIKKLKMNIDSGAPTFIQEGARRALQDETHVIKMREEYRKKRDILVEAFLGLGFERCIPEGGIYIWQRLPKGTSSKDFAMRLLEPDIGIVVMPGAWLSEPVQGIGLPGEGYIRLALVPKLEEVYLAAEKIRRLKI
jgi:LL-diaminopimelate aminotransferase